MPRPTTILTIPQPCHESWAAMSPTATGRHCAACAKTVVDFTLATDAEILAYLARAAGGRTCGRFAAGQLERPLQRAALAAPTTRWQAWLAAAVAVWGLREGFTPEASAQVATEWRARYWGGPVPATPITTETMGNTEPINPDSAISIVPSSVNSRTIVRGVVRDAATHEALPGVVVYLAGLSSNVSTDRNGNFCLALPVAFQYSVKHHLGFTLPGYQPEQCVMPTAGNLLNVLLAADAASPGVEVAAKHPEYVSHRMGGAVAMVVITTRQPAPWRPRALYYWGKYWLSRPFRRN